MMWHGVMLTALLVQTSLANPAHSLERIKNTAGIIDHPPQGIHQEKHVKKGALSDKAIINDVKLHHPKNDFSSAQSHDEAYVKKLLNSRNAIKAFSVELSADIQVPAGQTIIFDKVLVNDPAYNI